MKQITDTEYSDEHACASCKSTNISEEEWKCLDKSLKIIQYLTPEERTSLFYVAGHISKRDGFNSHSNEFDIKEYIDDGDKDS